jgi:hypothetical protein
VWVSNHENWVFRLYNKNHKICVKMNNCQVITVYPHRKISDEAVNLRTISEHWSLRSNTLSYSNNCSWQA